MHRASLGVLAGVLGRIFRLGADRPVDVCVTSVFCVVTVASLACWMLQLRPHLLDLAPWSLLCIMMLNI
jgi:hypothetical protein